MYPSWEVREGDCIDVMRAMPAASVHCCVTSPPYYSLRDYGVAGQIGLETVPDCLGWATGAPCATCYVCRLVAVFREVRRVLRDDGIAWLNLGDSYNAYNGNRGASTSFQAATEQACPSLPSGNGLTTKTLKNKDLMMIPARVSLALQADGWYLRCDVIWDKPNPMPESVTDRPTKAHEYMFLLSKSERYYYDADAIKEPCVNGDPNSPRGSRGVLGEMNAGTRKQDALGKRTYTGFNDRYFVEPLTERNKRSVWRVATKPYAEAHFATFPPDLIIPCVRAGCPVDGTVFDPFTGSGTTGAVAVSEGRSFIGCDLNPCYVELARKRIRDTAAQGRLALL